MQVDKIVAIIPCYFLDQSFVEMTKKCVDTMNSTTHFGITLIIVNDGSPYEFNKFDSPYFNVPYEIMRPENGGYASAVNSALVGVKQDVDYIIICNNDIEFIDPHWLDHLLRPLKEGYDISSIRTTDTDGWITEDKITEDDKFGSIWAMKRIVYDTIGGLDESFGKGYFEDLDYHERARRTGFRIAKNHAGLVEHRGKATFRQIDPDDQCYEEAKTKFKKKYGKVW